ncbi:MAG: hypothetical protein QOF61_891 [Acidobacteriota bacterium]|jgi:hypothetical protein|nr:hypothetical protein [Acidobacteriota bacterium]
MKLRLTTTIIALLLGGLTLHAAQTASQQDAARLSQRQALGLVRTFNTAEAMLKLNGGKYGSLEDLLKVNYMRRSEFAMSDDFAAGVKDYKLSVVVSADGQHYQVSLRPEAGCGYALFSSDAAVIYEGNGLDCAKPAN